jgi:hypothetical protein
MSMEEPVARPTRPITPTPTQLMTFAMNVKGPDWSSPNSLFSKNHHGKGGETLR